MKASAQISTPPITQAMPQLLITDSLKKAEIHLSLHTAVHTSIRSIDHEGEIIKMHGERSVWGNMKLHQTKETNVH